jgi:hypothetical protein
MSKKFGKGWSSVRGRATHYYDAAEDAERALCGSPIRVLASEVVMRLKKLEICDHCQRERRLRPSGKRTKR